MKIGVISDTHDRLDSLQKAIEILKKERVQLIVHCGDWVSPFTIEFFAATCDDFQVPIKSVFGNNEGDIKRIIERNAKLKNPIQFSSKQTLELLLEDKKIIVYHGQDKVITESIIKSQMHDAFFTGHTHRVRNEFQGKTLILNPGSTSHTRESKITSEASMAIYYPETNKSDIITL